MKLRSILFFVFIVNGLIAQSLEYGSGFQVYVMPGNVLETNQLTNYNGPTTSSTHVFAILPTIGGQLAANFPFIDREGFSFGIQPGYLVNGMIRQGGFFLGGRGDLFLTWRTGAHASYANYVDDKRYYGMGIGYSLYSIFNTVDEYTDKIIFGKPALFLETGINDHKFKLFFQLVPYHSIYPSYTGGIKKITYWEMGITWERWNFFLGK